MVNQKTSFLAPTQTHPPSSESLFLTLSAQRTECEHNLATLFNCFIKSSSLCIYYSLSYLSRIFPIKYFILCSLLTQHKGVKVVVVEVVVVEVVVMVVAGEVGLVEMVLVEVLVDLIWVGVWFLR